MDAFGIGAGVKGVMGVYFQAARRTGRTTALLESLKDGDRVLFVHLSHADEFRRLCRERDLKVTCVVLPPRELNDVFRIGQSTGRTLFDHSWIEQHYFRRTQEIAEEIANAQTQLSGFGEAHLETRRAAEEINRWNPR